MDTTSTQNPNVNYFDKGQGGNPVLSNPNPSTNVPSPTIPTSINSTNTNPNNPSLITSPTPVTPNYAGITSSIPTLDSVLNTDPNNTPEAQTLKGSQARLETLMASLGGKTADQQTAEQANGVTDITKSLTDLNSQIMSLKNEATAIPMQNENRAIGRTGEVGVNANNTIDLRNNSIKALTLNSLAATLQGNLTVAKAAADKVVALKYDPIEAQIKAAQQQITDNMPFFTAAEQKQAAVTQANLAERSRLLTQQKEDTTTILGWGAAALKNGATNLQAQAISNAPDLKSAMALYLPYSVDPQATQKAVLDLEKTRADIALTKANTSKAYADAKKASGDASNVDPASIKGWVDYIHGGGKLSEVTGNPALKSAVVQALGASQGSSSTILDTTKASLKELNDMVTNNKGFSGAVGFKGILGSFTGPIAGSATADFAAKAKQVVNDVVLPNLTMLHGLGRVTDREFQALSQAITSLSIDPKNGTSSLSEGAFKTELKNLTDRINKLSTTDTNSDTVNVISPDGTEGTIPKDQLQEALKAGYKQK